MYAWIITNDIICDGDATGLIGPSGARPEDVVKLRDGDGERFRMYDDDGVLYYEGLFIGDSSSEDGFRPLDDYGTGMAGAVRIDYLQEDGTWETL